MLVITVGIFLIAYLLLFRWQRHNITNYDEFYAREVKGIFEVPKQSRIIGATHIFPPMGTVSFDFVIHIKLPASKNYDEWLKLICKSSNMRNIRYKSIVQIIDESDLGTRLVTYNKKSDIYELIYHGN